MFSKGVHLIVPQITPHRRILTFFADDGRLFSPSRWGQNLCRDDGYVSSHRTSA